MRYFFDIHLNGQCQLDEHGQDFRNLEDARNYVITCGRICLTDGSAARAVGSGAVHH